jgi:hypothetical protein
MRVASSDYRSDSNIRGTIGAIDEFVYVMAADTGSKLQN